MSRPNTFVTITEEGEAIGTLGQFAHSLNLTCATLYQTLMNEARECVIFCAGPSPNRLLILDACGLLALRAEAMQ